MINRFAFVAVASTLWMAGCGSTSANQGCTDFANARCAKQNSCNPSATIRDYGDLATCQLRETAACSNRLSATGSSATPSFDEGCSVAIPLETCPDFSDDNPSNACIAPPGGLADGSPCIANAQCKNGNCNLGPHTVCGSCGPPAQAGQSCETATCDRGLVCTGTPSVCVQLAALGQPCDKNTPCQVGGSCVGATGTTMGSCQAAVAQAGMPCDPTRAMKAGCDAAQELFCNEMSMSCDMIQFAPTGAACGTVNGVTVECAGAGGCYPANAKMGSCMAPAADGAACDTMVGPGCLSPAKCVITNGGTAGTCQLPDPTTCK